MLKAALVLPYITGAILMALVGILVGYACRVGRDFIVTGQEDGN